MQMVVVEPLMSDKLQVVGDVWRLCVYLDTLLLQLGWGGEEEQRLIVSSFLGDVVCMRSIAHYLVL